MTEDFLKSGAAQKSSPEKRNVEEQHSGNEPPSISGRKAALVVILLLLAALIFALAGILTPQHSRSAVEKRTGPLTASNAAATGATNGRPAAGAGRAAHR